MLTSHVLEDLATDTTAKAVAEEDAAGSFTKLTHAAEAFASHAASQAAGLFSYKKAEESKTQDSVFFFVHFDLLTELILKCAVSQG